MKWLAGFATEQALEEAVKRLDQAGVANETYTPMPREDASSSSILPTVMLIAGLIGAGGAFGLQTIADTWAFPIDVGGRPLFSWPTYVPMAFEAGALCAMIAGFVGFLILNRLPRPYATIDEVDAFRNASRDEFFVLAEEMRAREILAALHPATLAEVPEE